ncbi:hypothetical protein XELAEV_18015071mg [Xenopus laevis]|uniref:Palmitoyltransferase n=1 Tax=Xenopus laevis TaxID=8355 RepID=A0A974HVK5_XENLA|nr:hypothetical protein XELAEV_18015071mg [Xenopus laevis]
MRDCGLSCQKRDCPSEKGTVGRYATGEAGRDFCYLLLSGYRQTGASPEFFLQMYNMKPWLDKDGNQVPGRCLVWKVRGGRWKMSEMNPPAMMPQGNVGTPLKVFLQLIRSCRLPPKDDDTCEEWERHEALHEDVTTQDRIKEHLYEEEIEPYLPTFWKGTVPLKKGQLGGMIELKQEKGGSGIVFYTDAQGCTESTILDLAEPPNPSRKICPNTEPNPNPNLHMQIRAHISSADCSEGESREFNYYTAFYNQDNRVSAAMRNTTRKRATQKKWPPDFDEQTADDWDVDMSAYYEEDGVAKDARDSLTMRLETRRLDGLATADAEYNSETPIKYCRKCQFIKPDRCHHCTACDICILKVDHHCIFLNNCVGFSNYKFFLLFLLYVPLLLIFTSAVSLYCSILFWTDQLPNMDSKGSAIALFCMSTLFCIIFCYQYIYGHYSLVLMNETLLELIEGIHCEYNPYDLGYRKNWRQVFGNNKRYWFIPIFSSLGDGSSFPLGDATEDIEKNGTIDCQTPK